MAALFWGLFRSISWQGGGEMRRDAEIVGDR